MSSRKWERMVHKNQKKVNQLRAKSGQKGVQATKNYDLFKGKSLALPVFFIGIGLLYAFTFYPVQQSEGMYWFTVIAYIVLGLYFYALRKPYLKVSKNEVATRKWGRERIAAAKDIESIQVQGKDIIIQVRNSKGAWVFSKLLNRFRTDVMAETLKEFAHKNQVKFVSNSK